MPNTNKLKKTQANNDIFQKLKEVLRSEETITVNEDELVCRKVLTDEATQIIVSERYRNNILYCLHCPTLAGHLGTRRMNDALRKIYNWPNMISNVQEIVF